MKLTNHEVRWIENGKHGLSSMTMFWKFTELWIGGGPSGPGNHPHDPDDFHRCLLLLDMVPAFKDRLLELRYISPQWEILIDNWDTITQKISINDGALAYHFMQDLFERVKNRNKEF